MDSIINDLNNKYDLINIWEAFEGKIECSYTKRIWNSAQLKEMSKDMAKHMSDSGFKRGDIVAVLLSNTAAFPIALAALLYIGCNPLLLHVSTPLPELVRLSKKVPMNKFVHDFIESTSRINMEETEIWQYQVENIVLKAGRLKESLERQQGIDMSGVILHLTSGTCGEPRICIRNQEVAVAEAVNYVSIIDIFDRAKIMVTTPLSHAFAYGFGLVSTLLTHSTMALDVAFNPKKVLRLMTENNYDILTIVPPMAKTLIQLKKVNPDFKIAKTVFYAGTRCDEAIIKEFEEIFGVRLYSIYGSTETSCITTNYSRNGKLDYIGTVYENVDIKIINEDKYTDIGKGVGEICVKSTGMMQGYYSLNNTGLKKIDYFPTGDIGTYSGKILNIVGRIKDIINVGGLKMDPAEIEGVIILYPGITDVVVYPGKGENGQEIILCAIRTNEAEVNIDDLRTYCLKNLSSYKIPRTFYILDEIPRTASGKCVKARLPGYVPGIDDRNI